MDKTSIEKVLTVLSRGRIRYWGPAGERTRIENVSSSMKLDKQGRIFYWPQSHDAPEIIFGLSGNPEIYANGKWLKFGPGRLWALLPGAVHSERYIRQNNPYQILWIVISAGRIGFHITAYTPTRGYHLVGKRLALQVSLREDLFTLASRPEMAADPILQIHFQTMLLDGLYQVIPYMDKHSNRKPEVKVPYHHHIIEQIKHHLDERYAAEVSLPELAGMVHYSPCHLNLLFRRQIGVPVRQYLLKKRLAKARELLKTTEMEIKQIAYSVGFKDPLYFSRLYRRVYGVSPSGNRG